MSFTASDDLLYVHFGSSSVSNISLSADTSSASISYSRNNVQGILNMTDAPSDLEEHIQKANADMAPPPSQLSNGAEDPEQVSPYD